MRPVAGEARGERSTELIARLEALARVAGRLPLADAQRLVELATVATMRAVALELLKEEPATLGRAAAGDARLDRLAA
jgi:hypothetical protein